MFLLFDAVYKADYKEASLQELGVGVSPVQGLVGDDTGLCTWAGHEGVPSSDTLIL